MQVNIHINNMALFHILFKNKDIYTNISPSPRRIHFLYLWSTPWPLSNLRGCSGDAEYNSKNWANMYGLLLFMIDIHSLTAPHWKLQSQLKEKVHFKSLWVSTRMAELKMNSPRLHNPFCSIESRAQSWGYKWVCISWHSSDYGVSTWLRRWFLLQRNEAVDSSEFLNCTDPSVCTLSPTVSGLGVLLCLSDIQLASKDLVTDISKSHFTKGMKSRLVDRKKHFRTIQFYVLPKIVFILL